MACHYYVKLPNGGEVKILASFTTIENSGNTAQTFTDLQNTAEDFYEDEDAVLTYDSPILKYLIALKTGLSVAELKKIIKASNAGTLITNLNKKFSAIEKDANLAYSLKKYVWFNNSRFDYVGPQNGKGTISLEEFLNALKTPIGKKYFNSITSANLLDIKSLTDVTDDIVQGIEELAKINVTQATAMSLKRVLDAAFYKSKRKDKMFYNITFDTDVNDAIVVTPKDSETPIIFYNGLNDLSLFMGAFKHLGSLLPKEQVLPIISEYNAALTTKKTDKDESQNTIDLTNFDVKKFFLGEFITGPKTVSFKDPDFNKVFRFKKNADIAINKLIDLIVPTITTDAKKISTLTSDFQKLFRAIDPVKYGKNLLEDERIAELSNVESRRNKELVAEIRGRKLLPLIEKEERDYYYSRPIAVPSPSSVQDVYNYLENNVSKNRDLVTVTVEGKGQFKPYEQLLVPTEFYMTSKGVRVTGFYEKDGKLVWEKRGLIYPQTSKEVTSKEGIAKTEIKNATISYRELLSESTVIETTDSVKLPTASSIMIHSPAGEYLPPDLVKMAAVRGGIIFSKNTKAERAEAEGKGEARIVGHIIKGVYPGTIKQNSVWNSKSKTFVEANIGINNVTKIISDRDKFTDEFTDSNIEEKKNILSQLEEIVITGDFNPVEVGDYVLSLDKKYNKVVGITEDSVYILIKTGAGNYSSQALPKSQIGKIFKPKVAFSIQSLQPISSFHKRLRNDQSISESDYSSIDSYEAARNNDYFVSHKANGDYEIYIITNKEKQYGIKLIINSEMIVSQQYAKLPVDLSDYTIITRRNIYSDFAGDTAEINNVFITTEPKPITDNARYEEVKYFIPKGTKVSELTLLGSGNLIRGIMKPLNMLDRVPEGYYDVTEEMISLLNKTRNYNPPRLTGKETDEEKEAKRPKLLIKVKGENNGYYVRYNARLYQTDYEPKYRDLLTDSSYIVLKNPANPTKAGAKTYRVIARVDNTLVLEYATYNREGKPVSIQKTLDLDTQEDTIKYLYVMKDTQNFYKLRKMQQDAQLKAAALTTKTEKELRNERTDNIISISKTFKEIFNIAVHIEDHPKEANKKAWVKATEGKPEIIINLTNENAGKEDLVHEYLHLFLIALKYNSTGTSQNLYEQLLVLYKEAMEERDSTDKAEMKKLEALKTAKDWSVIEEYFVKDLSAGIVKGDLEELVNFNAFKQVMDLAIANLGITNYVIDDSNIFSLLNSSMSSIFPRVNPQISQSGLVLFELNFRKWLDKQVANEKIKIIC